MQNRDTKSCGSRRGACFACLLCAALAVLPGSCIKSKPAEKKAVNKEKECEATRSTILDLAQPTRLGIDTQLEDLLGQLNEWQESCLSAEETKDELGPIGGRLLKRLLTDERMNLATRKHFAKRDAFHLRNSLFLWSIEQEVLNRTVNPGDAEQHDLRLAVNLFYYVVRNIELVDRHPAGLPMPLFRVLLLGRGTAEDRAWVFAGLLRQRQIPAVILSPKNRKPGPNADGVPFVVGVLGKESIWLFDPRLGLPIPPPDDRSLTPLIRRPATLRQFVEDPKVAAQLKTESFSYPLAPADLKSPRVQLIGHSSLWSPRMKQLREPFFDQCVIYENLDRDQRGPGLVSRVASQGGGFWTKDDIELWPYPERVYARYEALTADQRSARDRLAAPLSAPYEFKVVERTVEGRKVKERVPGQALYAQFKSRVSQWRGKYDDSVREYLFVKTSYDEKIAAMPESMKRARDDAEFWSGVCRYEQFDQLNDPRLSGTSRDVKLKIVDLARQSLDLYVGQRGVTKWADQAHYMIALCHTGRQLYRTAKLTLKRITKTHPQHHGFAILQQRWERLAVHQEMQVKNARKQPVVARRPQSRKKKPDKK